MSMHSQSNENNEKTKENEMDWNGMEEMWKVKCWYGYRNC
jgi:hypothetical protein